MEIKDLPKIRKGIFIPTLKKKKRGNPNEYLIVPQKGDETEYDMGLKYCPNCKKEMPSINKWIEQRYIESYWLQLCKECGAIVEEGISIIETEEEEEEISS